jgi:hypothetical protein
MKTISINLTEAELTEAARKATKRYRRFERLYTVWLYIGWGVLMALTGGILWLMYSNI